ncbi:MAG: DUF6498-containing protein [Aeromicrobium sp.]
MQLLLRVLGLNLLAQFGSRLPGAVVRTITSLVLIGANLLPIHAVVNGTLGLGDVFVLYWIENVLVYLATIVRLLTVQPRDEFMATFFPIHYGIFTAVHGAFALVFAGMTGWFAGGSFYWIVVVAAMFISQLVSLGLNWFGRGEYRAASPSRVAFAPYPRMLAMHGAIIAGAFLVFGLHPSRHAVQAVAILCGAKTLIDLTFHLVERALYGQGQGARV